MDIVLFVFRQMYLFSNQFDCCLIQVIYIKHFIDFHHCVDDEWWWLHLICTKALVDEMMNTTDFHHLVDLVIAASDLYEISGWCSAWRGFVHSTKLSGSLSGKCTFLTWSGYHKPFFLKSIWAKYNRQPPTPPHHHHHQQQQQHYFWLKGKVFL